MTDDKKKITLAVVGAAATVLLGLGAWRMTTGGSDASKRDAVASAYRAKSLQELENMRDLGLAVIETGKLDDATRAKQEQQIATLDRIIAEKRAEQPDG